MREVVGSSPTATTIHRLPLRETSQCQHSRLHASCCRRARRLDAAGLCRTKPVIDPFVRESTHVVFGLGATGEDTPARELGIGSVFEVYVAFPGP